MYLILKSYKKEFAFSTSLIVVFTYVNVSRMHSEQITVMLHGIRTSILIL